jgi:hypothetical protein
MSRVFKIFLLIFMALLIILASGLVTMREELARRICKSAWASRAVKRLAKYIVGQDALVIFVHGTFGSTMSLLDLPTVNNDKVEGSKYKLLIDKMRNNPLFWQDQAVLGRGLVLVDPYSAPKTFEEQLSGAHSILRAFVEVDRAVGRNRNVKTYTCGWSGLLSQQRRRREAVRFYNQIAEELVRLELEDGIFEPQIEIISHSHGGNLALNLAGVYHMLNGGIDALVDTSLPTKQEFEMLMLRLRPKDDLERFLDGQHRFDYLPTKHNLKVDRLVMMGTPLQPKNYALAASEFFGQVFNIYSEEDAVQKMDYVSCCSDTENRKFKLKKEVDRGTVFQVRISVCSDQVLKGSQAKAKQDTSSKLAWWQVFMGMKDISRSSWDPTHKELWFLVGDLAPDEPQVLKPLPVVVFTPLIVDAVNESGFASQDLDVDLSVQGGKLLAFVAEHKIGNYQIVKSISNSFVRQLAQSVAACISTEQSVLNIKLFIQKLMDEWKQMHSSG